VRPMDIEEFYEEDPRRRASNEIELGAEWKDSDDVNYELNYVVDTGELYTMAEPAAKEREDILGDISFPKDPSYVKRLGVRVVAKIESVDLLHKVLDGWEQAMQTGTIDWLDERLRVAGVATTGDTDPS
jgi:hypothetical protein